MDSQKSSTLILGELLAAAQRTVAESDVAVILHDSALLARIDEAAENLGIARNMFILGAVQAFEREASPDDWVSMMGVVAKEPDPGKACLRRMVEWALLRWHLLKG